MGVQRKPMEVNWLASFGMIIFAGSLYRLRKVNKVLLKAQMKDVMERLGIRLYDHQKPSILIQQVPMKRGEWEKIKQRSDQYRFHQKVHSFFNMTERLFFTNKKTAKK